MPQRYPRVYRVDLNRTCVGACPFVSEYLMYSCQATRVTTYVPGDSYLDSSASLATLRQRWATRESQSIQYPRALVPTKDFVSRFG